MRTVKHIKNLIISFIMTAAIAIVAFASMGAAGEAEIMPEYIFTHELVFDTEKAFSPDNSLRNCFDKDHLTATEFARLLEALYDKGYALISLDDGLNRRFPRGKKPLVLSFDDMTYDTKNRGCVDKIVWHYGEIYDYTESASPKLSRERENVTILERFIEAHPDFSPTGARATLCVNGYNGILGYRCTPTCGASERLREAEAADCKKLVDKMKERGYSFVSHTYYHKYFNGMSASDIQKDCECWESYVAPIVGKTNVLCYPAGEHRAKSPKNEVFKRHGYNVFLCVGDYAGTDSERSSKDEKYVYRLPFDGTALRLYRNRYSRLVDTRAIYDESRFRPFEYNSNYYK